MEFFNLTALFPMLFLVPLFSVADILVWQRCDQGTCGSPLPMASNRPHINRACRLMYYWPSPCRTCLTSSEDSQWWSQWVMAIIVGESGGTVMPRCSLKTFLISQHVYRSNLRGCPWIHPSRPSILCHVSVFMGPLQSCPVCSLREVIKGLAHQRCFD